MAGKSYLEEEGVREELAELLAAGATLKTCAEHFGNHKDTIRRWKQDAKVIELTRKIRQARVDEIVQKVDGAIHGKLAAADKLPVRDLLEIRKTYQPESNATGKKDNQTAAEELWEKIGDHPELAEKIKDATGS